MSRRYKPRHTYRPRHTKPRHKKPGLKNWLIKKLGGFTLSEYKAAERRFPPAPMCRCSLNIPQEEKDHD